MISHRTRPGAFDIYGEIALVNQLEYGQELLAEERGASTVVGQGDQCADNWKNPRVLTIVAL